MAGLLPLLLLLLTSISTVRSSDPDTVRRRTHESLGIRSERPCRLPGVACSPSSLRATRIRLPSRRLPGSVSGNPDPYGVGTVPPKRRYILEESKNDPSSSSSSSSIAVAPAPDHNHYYTYAVGSPAPSPMPSSTSRHRSSGSHKARNWILGFLTGVIAGALSGVVMSVIFRMFTNCIRGRHKDYYGGAAIFSPTIIKNAEDLAFLEKDDVVASLEVVGRGGCGEVYRAPLPNNPDTIVAIKKITKRSADGAEPGEDESRLLDKWMRQIRSEIVTVGRIRHRNLLPLLAHVTRPDCHFLVYEFMKNGSLHDAMKSSSSVELDWLLRHRIAVGVAAGLEYLHVHHKPHIIHRDLKPANILLDDRMEARIADFGLAKEVPDGNTHMTGSNVAGTCGYIAPEYHQTLKFTTKCDMYSFGVILAVLVVGKFPSDDFFQDTDEMNLVKWLRNVMNSEDPAAAAIDPKLKGNGYEEQMLLVLKIACFCTMDDPRERPSSKEVRVMLSQIVH